MLCPLFVYILSAVCLHFTGSDGQSIPHHAPDFPMPPSTLLLVRKNSAFKKSNWFLTKKILALFCKFSPMYVYSNPLANVIVIFFEISR